GIGRGACGTGGRGAQAHNPGTARVATTPPFASTATTRVATSLPGHQASQYPPPTDAWMTRPAGSSILMLAASIATRPPSVRTSTSLNVPRPLSSTDRGPVIGSGRRPDPPDEPDRPTRQLPKVVGPWTRNAAMLGIRRSWRSTWTATPGFGLHAECPATTSAASPASGASGVALHDSTGSFVGCVMRATLQPASAPRSTRA